MKWDIAYKNWLSVWNTYFQWISLLCIASWRLGNWTTPKSRSIQTHLLLWSYILDSLTFTIEYAENRGLSHIFIENISLFFMEKNIDFFFIHQAFVDHVKVGLTPILALQNLWHQINMFLDILKFRVKKKYEKMFW